MGVGKIQALNALDVRQYFIRGCVDTSVRTTGQDEHFFVYFCWRNFFVVVVW